MPKKYQHAILGGTFDHFHAGHKYFITAACKKSKKITIGLTLPILFKNKLLAGLVESYKIRKKNLEKYLKSKNCQFNIIPLTDIYGNSLKEKNIDAIFVTKNGLRNANLINKARKKINFPFLSVNKVSLIKGNDNKIISSQRIRRGTIDKKGAAYINIFKNNLLLPSIFRKTLRKPLGKTVRSLSKLKEIKNKLIISVGDVTTNSLINSGYRPNVSIIDLKTQRQKMDMLNTFLPKNRIKCQNPAGIINKQAVLVFKKTLEKSLAKNQNLIIQVEGEEDLLVLPAILLAPLNSLVFYGLPQVGAAMINVTERKKTAIKKLLSKFYNSE